MASAIWCTLCLFLVLAVATHPLGTKAAVTEDLGPLLQDDFKSSISAPATSFVNTFMLLHGRITFAEPDPHAVPQQAPCVGFSVSYVDQEQVGLSSTPASNQQPRTEHQQQICRQGSTSVQQYMMKLPVPSLPHKIDADKGATQERVPPAALAVTCQQHTGQQLLVWTGVAYMKGYTAELHIDMGLPTTRWPSAAFDQHQAGSGKTAGALPKGDTAVPADMLSPTLLTHRHADTAAAGLGHRAVSCAASSACSYTSFLNEGDAGASAGGRDTCGVPPALPQLIQGCGHGHPMCPAVLQKAPPHAAQGASRASQITGEACVCGTSATSFAAHSLSVSAAVVSVALAAAIWFLRNGTAQQGSDGGEAGIPGRNADRQTRARAAPPHHQTGAERDMFNHATTGASDHGEKHRWSSCGAGDEGAGYHGNGWAADEPGANRPSRSSWGGAVSGEALRRMRASGAAVVSKVAQAVAGATVGPAAAATTTVGGASFGGLRGATAMPWTRDEDGRLKRLSGGGGGGGGGTYGRGAGHGGGGDERKVADVGLSADSKTATPWQ